MIEVIFTLDYEIYGDGLGSVRDLIYEPAQELKDIFNKRGKRFVAFVEVAELERIEEEGSDEAIDHVKRQIKELHSLGHEIGLHIHPQWYKAQREDGRWLLDYGEYNLCSLARERIAQIIDRSILFLRYVLEMPDFTPLSFRAGNWLLQPAREVASVLAERGIRVDSSVFKGGLRHQQGLDYRPAVKNGYYWKFSVDANVPDPGGVLLELPIYTQMVPFWRMPTGKRIGLEQKGSAGARSGRMVALRLMDFLRFRYPLKLDFCRMSIGELTRMVDEVIREDLDTPSVLRPLVAIGHTKELVDTETVEAILAYLEEKEIPVSTFEEVFARMLGSRDVDI